MIPQIQFLKPRDVQEAAAMLADHKDGGRLIAGGTDIVPGFHMQSTRFKDINVLIDIHRLEELNIIEKKGNAFKIGAAVTFSRLAAHQDLRELFPVLTKAALSVGCWQIRNRGTIAGNFVNNAPCADTVAPLLVYDTVISVLSSKGKRELPLADFLLKSYQTQLRPDEIVTHILLPIPGNRYRGDFYKLGRRRGTAISRISLALLADIRDSVFKDLRIASGAVTPIGKRFESIERSAKDKSADSVLFKQLAQDLGRQVLEITGLRWSSPYKLPVVQQTFYQLLEKVCHNGGKQEEN
jgi:CO/xanthine dehydrogenase FAD-binding subunit